MMQNHSGLIAKYSPQPHTRTIPRDLTPEHPLELNLLLGDPLPLLRPAKFAALPTILHRNCDRPRG